VFLTFDFRLQTFDNFVLLVNIIKLGLQKYFKFITFASKPVLKVLKLSVFYAF